MQPTPGSRSSVSTAWRSSPVSCWFRTFNALGLFSVIRPTLPLGWIKMVSYVIGGRSPGHHVLQVQPCIGALGLPTIGSGDLWGSPLLVDDLDLWSLVGPG